MKKFRHACFCYMILWAYAHDTSRTLWSWMLMMRGSRAHAGWITIGADGREQIADWALMEIFAPMDFDTVLHVLGGDEYYARNKRDVAKLERSAGKSVTMLWDTDPIFTKYPHLRGLARNKEFEKIWSKIKEKQK